MTFVLATSRPWNENMAKRLTERTGQPFHLITRKEDLTPERLREIAPRAVFFPHWSYLIPATIHEGWECVIFHMTDLPYGRGGSPLQNLIQRGHRETVLTALRNLTPARSTSSARYAWKAQHLRSSCAPPA
ncbi:hypothetical protein [Halochromatium salexigens]|uniref:hypothetical protein n=1 Tax=Halochromatium salexigens TaxID=49447 RepID=UPI001911DDED|nr:hypothetical protein [Halochromatium salexigens]